MKKDHPSGDPNLHWNEPRTPSGSLVDLVLAFCEVQDAWLDALDDGMKLPADWAAAYKAMAYAAQDAERMGQPSPSRDVASEMSPAYCPYCPHCHPRTANAKAVCELCGAIEPAPDATSDTGHVHLTCIYAVDRERTRAMRVDEAMRQRERMADVKTDALLDLTDRIDCAMSLQKYSASTLMQDCREPPAHLGVTPKNIGRLWRAKIGNGHDRWGHGWTPADAVNAALARETPTPHPKSTP